MIERRSVSHLFLFGSHKSPSSLPLPHHHHHQLAGCRHHSDCGFLMLCNLIWIRLLLSVGFRPISVFLIESSSFTGRRGFNRSLPSHSQEDCVIFVRDRVLVSSRFLPPFKSWLERFYIPSLYLALFGRQWWLRWWPRSLPNLLNDDSRRSYWKYWLWVILFVGMSLGRFRSSRVHRTWANTER